LKVESPIALLGTTGNCIKLYESPRFARKNRDPSANSNSSSMYLHGSHYRCAIAECNDKMRCYYYVNIRHVLDNNVAHS